MYKYNHRKSKLLTLCMTGKLECGNPGVVRFCVVECADPFVEVGDGCYFASASERQSWTGAREVCEALGGHLAVIHSQPEQDLLVEYLNTVYPGRDLTPQHCVPR